MKILDFLCADAVTADLKATTKKELIEEMTSMMVDAGAKLYACKMSVEMMDLKKEDFVDGVIDIVTASDFIDMTEGGQIIFI